MNLSSASPAKLSRLHPSRSSVTFVVFVALFASALGGTARSVPQDATQATVVTIREAWVKNLHTKQLEPILKFYATDAVFLQPTGERITGSTAIRTLFQNIMATFDSDLILHSQNFETSGNLAFDSGDFQETLTAIASGSKSNAKGSYLIIFKRQLNGTWLILQQVFTGTPPPGT